MVAAGVGSVVGAGSAAGAGSVTGAGSAVATGSAAGAGSAVALWSGAGAVPSAFSRCIENALVESVADGVGSGAGVALGSGVVEGVGVGAGVVVGVGSGFGVVEGGVLDPTVAGPEVPGPQFSVLLELLELDELVTVPCPSSVVTGVEGFPPEETSTQLEEGAAGAIVLVGVNVTLVATERARVIAFCTTGATVSPTTGTGCAATTGAGATAASGESEIGVGTEIPEFTGKLAALAEVALTIGANAITVAERTAVTHSRGVGFIEGLAYNRSGQLYPRSCG